MTREIRSTISTTNVPRTGILTVVRVVDLEALEKEHGESIPVAELEKGLYQLTLEREGKKDRTFGPWLTESEADAFVEGFKACADARRRGPRKAKKAGDGA